MKISEFIRENVFLARLRDNGVLLVYDPDERYRAICESISDDKTRVIDAAKGSIEGREAASKALRMLGRKSGRRIDHLLVYVPSAKPDEDQILRDPFSAFGVAGTVFPRGDGDNYLSICCQAKPDFDEEIRAIFRENPRPSFDVIDAVGGGKSWPQLRACLKVDSALEVLLALLNPSEDQLDSLKRQEGWHEEVKGLVRAVLGVTLKTRAKSLGPIADELWRLVLFSEFVFDLPVELPQALSAVPVARPEAKKFVEDLCDRLRAMAKVEYLYRAEEVERELALPKMCAAIEDLGERDTFPFEEKTFLRQAVESLLGDDLDRARTLVTRAKKSVWGGRGESVEQWTVIEAALDLIDTCSSIEPQLSGWGGSLEALVDAYATEILVLDRRHRELEQAAAGIPDLGDVLAEVLKEGRRRYRKVTDLLQGSFLKLVEASGWPPAQRLWNVDVFDRHVAELLKTHGNRVAYVMVDALRYELGVALERQLAEDHEVEVKASCAQLPTITPVGMASLLPGARDLTLSAEGKGLVPSVGGTPIKDSSQRMDVIRKRYGDRFEEMRVDSFLKDGKVKKGTDLLVLRTTEIDANLETNAELAFKLIPDLLNRLRAALKKLGKLGFATAVIVTDHGFCLNSTAEVGDVCAKPVGDWPYLAHDRMLLGNGPGDAFSYSIAAEKLGMKGDFARAAGPRSLAPYKAGYIYFHGGLSLQEALVPVLIVRFKPEKKEEAHLSVGLAYREGTTKIRTLRPVVDVSVMVEGLFEGGNVEMLIEAVSPNGDVVGELQPGGLVNGATGTITLSGGSSAKVVIKMVEEYEGKVQIRALEPETQRILASIDLETDYMR